MSLATTASNDAGARRATRAVRAGIDRDSAFGAVTPPLVLSSNFSFAGFAEKRQYDYTRSGNPTRLLWTDRPLQAILLGWLVLFVFLIY